MLKKILNKVEKDGLMALLLALVQYPFKFNHRKKYQEMLSKSDLKDRFTHVYDNNLWSSTESLSGEGSQVDYTEPLREWLITNLPKLNVNIFVDAPCGDFNWMQLVLPHLDIQYIGLDIVPSVIKKNNQLYSSNNVSFDIANICDDELPSCDVIMVRDCLFHLSFEDINKFFKNLESTNYKYLLTTTHIVKDSFVNSNISSGDFRLINLFKPPFNFNKSNVTEHVIDFPKGYSIPREMILIKKEFVPTNLNLESI